MAHPDTGNGGEAGGAPAQDTLSRFAAFVSDDEQNNTPPAEGEDDAPPATDDGEDIQAEEAPETGAEAADETTDQADEPAPPAIDPPVSWSAEAKAEFAKLPPEAQKIIAQRESERERFVQAKATEAAEARKVREAIEAQAAATHNAYLQTLQSLLPEIPAEPDPAWLNTAAYGDEGPQSFYAQQQARSAAIAQHQHVQQLMAQAVQHRDTMDAQSRAAYDAEQHAILSDPQTGIPGWSNPETRAALAADITAAAQALGYTPDRLAEVDATDVKALHAVAQMKAKADKWDALQKQKMETVRSAKDLPRVSKPGTPSPKGSAQAERYAQERDYLRKTGRVRNDEALFGAFV